MYDCFGEARVDDEVLSTKRELTQTPIRKKNKNDTGLEIEIKAEHAEVATPPRGSRTYATERGEQANTRNQISKNIRTIEPVPVATGQRQQPETSTSLPKTTRPLLAPPSSSPPSPTRFRLRALTGNKIEEGQQTLDNKLDVNSLSLSLIEETLSYFISCKQRLSQITKTFDDSNALIMLLQEKEEDLEVVGQLGQDLLRRYNELKEAYEGQRRELARFQEELAKCQDDNQQLRYDLASNKSLLETFKEEEENLLDEQNTSASMRMCPQCQVDDDGQPLSLRSQPDRSLVHLENEFLKQMCELKDELMEMRQRELNQKLLEQERNSQLEMKIRDTTRRQRDLESENESLRDEQRELQQVIETQSRRFEELLRIFTEYQRESRAHLTCNNNNNDISFNSQTEPSTSFDSQLNSLLFIDQPHHPDRQKDLRSNSNHRHGALPTSTLGCKSSQQHQNQQIVRPIIRKCSTSNLVTSTSLHEELLESMRKPDNLHNSHEDDEDENEYADQDGVDSGLQTRNISTSTTPVNSVGLNYTDTDSDDATHAFAPNSTRDTSSIDSNNKNTSERSTCLGLSFFTLTTLLLLCLSATFNATTNSNLAQRLQQINLNQ